MEVERSLEEESINLDIENVVELVGEVSNLDDSSKAMEPAAGMIFDSVKAITTFYWKYSNPMGFGWKTRTSRKGRDGELNYLILACNREGISTSKVPRTTKTLPTVAAKCRAKVTIKKAGSGKWYIKTIVLEHSRDLSSSKARLFKKNKNISMHVRRTIELNDEARVRINKTFQTLVHDAGGHESLQFVKRDVSNYIHKERRAIGKEGDVKVLVEYFYRMKKQNNNLWYFCRMKEQNNNLWYNIDFD